MTAATLLMVGAGAVACVVIALLLYVTIINPSVRLYRSSAEARALDAQVKAKRAERDRLHNELEVAKTDDGSEGIARGLGYINPEEHAIRIQVVPPAAAAPADTPTAGGNMRLFWGSLLGAFLAGFTVLFLLRRALRRRARPDDTLRTREKVVKKARRFDPAPEEG